MSLRIYQTRAEWAADRRSGAPAFEVGASDAAGLVGLSPWASPWDSWAAGAVGGGSPPAEADARRGHLVEATAAALWAAEAGVHLWGSDGLWSPDEDTVPRLPLLRARAGWLAVTPDALGIEPSGARIAIETKAPRTLDAWPDEDAVVRDPDAEGVPVPPQYAVQAACQMYALHAVGVTVAAVVLVASSGWAWRRAVRIEATPAGLRWATRVVAHVGAARRRILLERREPDPDASAACLAELRSRLPPRPATIEGTDEDAALVAAFAEARAQEAEAAAAIADLRPRILARLTGAGANAILTPSHRLTADKRGALKVTNRSPE